MKAKVTQKFKGVPDGETTTRDFHLGDEVTGDLARVAVNEGWAKQVREGAAGNEEGGKSSAASQPDQASTEKTAKKSGKKK